MHHISTRLALTAALMGLGASGTAGGCRKATASAPATRPPPQVAVVRAERATIPVTYRFIGMTEPRRSVEVRSRVTGFLLSRSFEEGKPVKAGQLLFTIDPAPFEADLQIARARQAQAEAQVGLTEAELRRYTEAAAAGAVAQSELDRAQTAVVNARASLNLSMAEVRKAELDLSYTGVHSPVTGLIGRSLKDEGSYLDAGSNSLLAVATQTDPMYVTFSIPERDWLRWREQAQSGEIRPAYSNPDGTPVDIANPRPPVRITLLDGTPYPAEGRLSFFDPRIDAGTGSAVARATLPNPDAQLKAGLFVHVTIVGWERPNSIIVPQRSVVNNSGGAFVYVVNDKSVVEMHKVTLGEWSGDGWLIPSGINPGDTVIADGFAKAPPGTTVTTVPFTPGPGKPNGDAGPGVPGREPRRDGAPPAEAPAGGGTAGNAGSGREDATQG